MIDDPVLPAAEPRCDLPQHRELIRGDRPLFLLLDLVNRCNLLCEMCFYPGQANAPLEAMGPEEVMSIVDAAFPVCHQALLSCSYEPFIQKNFVDFVEMATAKGIPDAGFTTNGMLLDEKRCHRLISSGLRLLAVSIDGATPETYERIRKRGDFGRVLQNLKTLVAAKQAAESPYPLLQLNFVLVDDNVDEVVEFVETMSALDPYKVVLIHRDYTAPSSERQAVLKPILRRALDACVQQGVLFEEVPNVCLSWPEVLEAYGVATSRAPQLKSGCLDPWTFLGISPSGDIRMCAHIERPVGNLRESSLAEIWDGAAYRKLRSQWNAGSPPEDCNSCPYFGTGVVQLRRAYDQMETLMSEGLAAMSIERRNAVGRVGGD